ncbi:ABSCISIC ACID-INSENSITIVE 5-like protein 2 [Bidens hawaiensis]|uniref:ABSCISIC ACID-INSENSITIVE 5-like protein 2 n=1 Tax=Bidens hawaiensis TaxID=980011 RepID=UPI00404A8960
MGSNGEPKSDDGLGRQTSIYDLTLDEVQHQLGHLGKHFTSMNLDDLFKTISNAETNMNLQYSNHAQHGPVSSLARQSGLNLTQDLRKKTVDEVWQGIQQGSQNTQNNNNNNSSSGNNNNNNDKRGDRERQPTLGEMTLEDFLVKAGIVAGSGTKNVDSNQQWMQYQVAPIQQQQVYVPGHHTGGQQSLTIGANPMMDLGYSETTQMTLSDTQTPGRKRVASGDVMEKTEERRQKKMIKNRESAARLRARKQAYTHELENKISRLEEENERLKRQKEVGMVLPSAPPPKTKYQLRRTSSASF